MHPHPDTFISQVMYEVFTDFTWALVEFNGPIDDMEIHIMHADLRDYLELKHFRTTGEETDIRIAELLLSNRLEDVLKEYILVRYVLKDKHIISNMSLSSEEELIMN